MANLEYCADIIASCSWPHSEIGNTQFTCWYCDSTMWVMNFIQDTFCRTLIEKLVGYVSFICMSNHFTQIIHRGAPWQGGLTHIVLLQCSDPALDGM